MTDIFDTDPYDIAGMWVDNIADYIEHQLEREGEVDGVVVNTSTDPECAVEYVIELSYDGSPPLFALDIYSNDPVFDGWPIHDSAVLAINHHEAELRPEAPVTATLDTLVNGGDLVPYHGVGLPVALPAVDDPGTIHEVGVTEHYPLRSWEPREGITALMTSGYIDTHLTDGSVLANVAGVPVLQDGLVYPPKAHQTLYEWIQECPTFTNDWFCIYLNVSEFLEPHFGNVKLQALDLDPLWEVLEPLVNRHDPHYWIRGNWMGFADHPTGMDYDHQEMAEHAERIAHEFASRVYENDIEVNDDTQLERIDPNLGPQSNGNSTFSMQSSASVSTQFSHPNCRSSLVDHIDTVELDGGTDNA